MRFTISFQPSLITTTLWYKIFPVISSDIKWPCQLGAETEFQAISACEVLDLPQPGLDIVAFFLRCHVVNHWASRPAKVAAPPPEAGSTAGSCDRSWVFKTEISTAQNSSDVSWGLQLRHLISKQIPVKYHLIYHNSENLGRPSASLACSWPQTLHWRSTWKVGQDKGQGKKEKHSRCPSRTGCLLFLVKHAERFAEHFPALLRKLISMETEGKQARHPVGICRGQSVQPNLQP